MNRLLTLALGLWAVQAVAQAPSVSLSVATGNTPTVSWDCKGAASCDASGPPSWAGPKANTGSQVVASITDTATYVIKASTGLKDFFDLTWSAASKNTDGSALTDLAGYEISKGTDPANLTVERVVAATVLTYRVSGLAPGVWYFSVKSINAASLKSAGTNPAASGTATAAQSASASATLKVPASPTGVTVN